MKIGILTHYYQSKNYGGNLQAYALCRVLEKMGHNAQQISLDRSSAKNIKCRIRDALDMVLGLREIGFWKAVRERNRALLLFNRQIPHSKTYTEKNICDCVGEYDAFVTGSDQVWHPKACCDAYLLKFVPSSKLKFSYAASVATNALSPECKQRYQEAFSDYRAISVREQDTVELLRDISPVDIKCTLDPTLLLSKEEWEEIIEPHCLEEKYVLGFFLGDDEIQRKTAREFSCKKGLKLVTFPHLLGKYRKCDADFGDIKLYDVTPGRFLSLVKDASFVITDSFHTTVFSLIFQKQHFVFPRSGAETMGVRLHTLTSMFETQPYFCDVAEKVNAEYIESLPPIDYAKPVNKFEEAKEASLRFLEEQLMTR